MRKTIAMFTIISIVKETRLRVGRNSKRVGVVSDMFTTPVPDIAVGPV